MEGKDSRNTPASTPTASTTPPIWWRQSYWVCWWFCM